MSIPIIDLSKISQRDGRIPSSEDWEVVSNEMKNALSKIGFVCLVNHDICQEKIQKAFSEGKKFFQLPSSTKEKYTKDLKKINHGYTKPGQELLDESGKFECRETFDFFRKKMDNGDALSEAPDFQSCHINLANECHVLVTNLLRILALSLKLDDEQFFVKSAQCLIDPRIPSFTTFRALYYPPISDQIEIQEGTVRCAEHSDYGILTLLFQDMMGGLEIKTLDGSWIPATPIEGSIFVNTGDLLEFWSGGFFPATKHRVLIPLLEMKRRTHRQSITYFVHPDDKVMVSPLKSSVVGNEDFQPVTAYEHAKKRLDKSYGI